jgi:hypothetical protein
MFLKGDCLGLAAVIDWTELVGDICCNGGLVALIFELLGMEGNLELTALVTVF